MAWLKKELMEQNERLLEKEEDLKNY